MSDPEKNYHLEFVTRTAPLADRLYELLEALSLPAKITVRKNSFVVYIKDSEAIAQLLGLIGAGGSMMAFYNIKIERELRNTVNRQVNCDSANLDKITAAAGRQIAAIQKIQQTTGFDNLPPVLGEIAVLRLENPEMSLKELGALLDPPIGKSGVKDVYKRQVHSSSGFSTTLTHAGYRFWVRSRFHTCTSLRTSSGSRALISSSAQKSR